LRRSSPKRIKVPSVVEAELRYGAVKSEKPDRTLRAVERFLSPNSSVPFDRACAAHYARIRGALESKGEPIGPDGLIIAATVRAHGGVLVTHNLREFARVDGLVLEDWTRG
jgi:tRNA(fMet)-specific endonuclease VapC